MKALKGGEYNYKEADYLGGGTFGKVYKGSRVQNGDAIAVKVIPQQIVRRYGEKLVKAIDNEIKTLQTITKVKNPYIIEIFDNFETTNNIYILTELCDGGTLQDTLDKDQRPSQKECLMIMFQIILGLSALSEKGIVHRDIKPENIFINQNVYKIGDFGFAREIQDKFSTQQGTCLYMGPEFYTGQAQTSKVDVWACGCMLHQLFFGSLAFDGDSQNDVQNAVKKGGYRPPGKLSADIEDLLMGMLKHNVDERYGVDELRMHRAFDFCRNQFASKLDRTLLASQFGTGFKSNLNKQQVGNFDPEQFKKMELMNQCHFISEDLLKYRNVCKFFFSNAEWLLKNAPDHDLTIFLMAKRATQKFAILYYFLKNEIFPNNAELSLQNCTQDGWKYFLQSDERAGITSSVIHDISESRKLFEKVLEKSLVTFASASKAVRDLLNDDMNTSYTNITEICMKHVVKHLLEDAMTSGNDPLNGQRLNVCLYLCILEGFEKKTNNEQTYKLSDFVMQVRQFTNEEKSGLIQNFLVKK